MLLLKTKQIDTYKISKTNALSGPLTLFIANTSAALVKLSRVEIREYFQSCQLLSTQSFENGIE